MPRVQGLARYMGEYVLEKGVEQFFLDSYVSVLCEQKQPHIVRTRVLFTSTHQKGVFVFCPVHCDFINCEVEIMPYREKVSRRE